MYFKAEHLITRYELEYDHISLWKKLLLQLYNTAPLIDSLDVINSSVNT